MTPSITSDSPQTQEIIDLLLSFNEAPEVLAELQEKADIRLDEMHRAAEAFFSEVDAQDSDFHQEFRTQIDQIEEEFRNYGDLLEDILDGEFHPESAAQTLAEASAGLRRNMALYEEAYLSRGDSPYPVVNLFRNLLLALDEGTTRPDIYTAACTRYQAYYQQTLDEIRQSGLVDVPGVSERGEAVESILRCLSELAEIRSHADAEDVLARFTATHAQLGSAFDTYHRHQFTDGPTKAPKLNWLIKAAQGVLDGTYKPTTLESLAKELLVIAQHNLTELKAIARNKLDSALLTEEIEHMLVAVEDLEDVFQFLLEYSRGDINDHKQVQKAINDMIAAGDSLAESIRITEQVQEQATSVTCVQCQSVQAKGGRTCTTCGALLPQLPEEGVYTHGSSNFQVLEGDPTDLDRDEVATDVMNALFEECEAFMKGSTTVQELLHYVDQSLLEVERAEAGLNQLKTPEMPAEVEAREKQVAYNFIDLAEDALILLDQGVRECRQGLVGIRESAQIDDLESLRQGMRSYYEGVQKMWQVKRLDRQFSQYIAEDEESATRLN